MAPVPKVPPTAVNVVVLPLQTVVVPDMLVGTTDGLLTLKVLLAVAAVQPVPAFEVSNNVTVPVKLAAGVYVTVDGVAVCNVLLNEPPPEVIDHAPVVALPPTLAPLNVMALGVAD